jgi:hypothetical protein
MVRTATSLFRRVPARGGFAALRRSLSHSSAYSPILLGLSLAHVVDRPARLAIFAGECVIAETDLKLPVPAVAPLIEGYEHAVALHFHWRPLLSSST